MQTKKKRRRGKEKDNEIEITLNSLNVVNIIINMIT